MVVHCSADHATPPYFAIVSSRSSSSLPSSSFSPLSAVIVVENEYAGSYRSHSIPFLYREASSLQSISARLVSTMTAIIAIVDIAYLTMRYHTNPRVPSAQYEAITKIFIVDYFFQYHVCPLLVWKAEREEGACRRPIRTPARIADKTNFEPPDEIRHTGCEFVIPKGALSLGTYRSVSNLFRFTNESNSMSRKARIFLLYRVPIGFYFFSPVISFLAKSIIELNQRFQERIK